LSTRYERALQEAEGLTEKSKTRLDASSEELERLLLQKEGESSKDNYVQAKPVGGKRAIGKAVAKGGLLLKGKNPGNVRPLDFSNLPSRSLNLFYRYSDKKTR
jgi:Rho GTPase-activating protein RGD1